MAGRAAEWPLNRGGTFLPGNIGPPHVTIMHKTRSWRWSLRDGQFLDTDPDPKDVPQEILKVVRQHMEQLQRTWNRMYPENPVDSRAETTVAHERKGKPKRKHKWVPKFYWSRRRGK